MVILTTTAAVPGAAIFESIGTANIPSQRLMAGECGAASIRHLWHDN